MPDRAADYGRKIRLSCPFVYGKCLWGIFGEDSMRGVNLSVLCMRIRRNS